MTVENSMTSSASYTSLLSRQDIEDWINVFNTPFPDPVAQLSNAMEEADRVSETYKPQKFSNGYWLMQGDQDPAKWLITAPDGQETHMVHNYRDDRSLEVFGSKGTTNKLPNTLPQDFFQSMVVNRVVGGGFSDEVAYFSRDLREEGYNEGFEKGKEEGYKEGHEKGFVEGEKVAQENMKSEMIEFMDDFFGGDFVDRYDS